MLGVLLARIRRRSFAERYLGTAVVVWLLYASLSAVLLYTAIPTAVAGGMAYSLALALHFSLHRHVVFRKEEREYHHDLSSQFGRYLLTALAQYSFTLFGTTLIVRETSLHRAPAYVACAACAAALNFLVLRMVVFRHRRLPEEPRA